MPLEHSRPGGKRSGQRLMVCDGGRCIHVLPLAFSRSAVDTDCPAWSGFCGLAGRRVCLRGQGKVCENKRSEERESNQRKLAFLHANHLKVGDTQDRMSLENDTLIPARYDYERPGT